MAASADDQNMSDNKEFTVNVNFNGIVKTFTIERSQNFKDVKELSKCEIEMR